jgi:hypothetical protein
MTFLLPFTKITGKFRKTIIDINSTKRKRQSEPHSNKIKIL